MTLKHNKHSHLSVNDNAKVKLNNSLSYFWKIIWLTATNSTNLSSGIPVFKTFKKLFKEIWITEVNVNKIPIIEPHLDLKNTPLNKFENITKFKKM